MSLIPHFFDVEPFPSRSRLLDQHFGLDLTPDDFLTAVSTPMALVTNDYYRPWRRLAAVAQDLGSSVKTDKEKMQLQLDVSQFKPEEITVKTSDGFIVVEGKHEEKKDDKGFVSRQFVRRYALPKDCQQEKIESRLSSDGLLTVVAPRTQAAIESERKVPIEHTGPAKSKEQKKEQKKEVKKR